MQTSGMEMPPVPQCFSHLVAAMDRNSYSNESSHTGSLNTSAVNCTNVHTDSPVESSDNSFVVPKLMLNGIHDSLNIRKYQDEVDAKLSTSEFASTLAVKMNNLEGKNSQDGPSNDKYGKLEQLAKESLNLKLVRKRPNDSGDASRFQNLDMSFVKLQEEMQSLRCMDINLFYQLVSLHESIQDFKMNVADRYSEYSGSEYSLGTASYMGSMSSLNEEADWNEENNFADEADGESSGLENRRKSASSLLQQITDLAKRADQDF